MVIVANRLGFYLTTDTPQLAPLGMLRLFNRPCFLGPLGLTWLCYIQEVYRSHNTNLINSLASGRCCSDFKSITFNFIIEKRSVGIPYEITHRLMPHNFSHEKSTLAQVMAWCRQATSHYLSQGGPISMSPYGVTKPQWVKIHIALIWKISMKFVCNLTYHMPQLLSLHSMCKIVNWLDNSNQNQSKKNFHKISFLGSWTIGAVGPCDHWSK